MVSKRGDCGGTYDFFNRGNPWIIFPIFHIRQIAADDLLKVEPVEHMLWNVVTTKNMRNTGESIFSMFCPQ